jgi:nickel/cobalt exporter
MKLRLATALFLAAGVLPAHPMGNFSVNHYAGIDVSARGAHIRYVLDLAEIPTFELLQQWKLEAGSPREQLRARAAVQAAEWAKGLEVTVGGQPVTPRAGKTILTMEKGAGDMPVMRIACDLEIAAAPGPLQYEDRNYAGRAGWKEIVVVGRDRDRSQALTAYPQDPTIAPPQDLRASVDWQPVAPAVSRKAPAPVDAPVMVAQTAAVTGGSPPQPEAPGTVVKGDYLSRLLHQGEIGWGMMLVGMAVAFGLGAMHALSPGHGKTIVAAYLVGARGTAKHAAFLGGMVTFTHTISVFFLGFVALFLSQYVLPERLYPVLGAISGLSIVWIGSTLLYKRWRKLRVSSAHHHHHHDHEHEHMHVHAHSHAEHSHGHGHSHSHDHGHAATAPSGRGSVGLHVHSGHHHDHGDGHVHSHVPEGDVTLGSLIALGASGGLVPCPSALVLLLSSITLGRVGLGLMLLLAFSAGLAMVLMAIGMVVVYAKHLLPDSSSTAQNGFFRVVPVLSAAVIVCLGVLMTAVSLGLIRPGFLGGV